MSEPYWPSYVFPNSQQQPQNQQQPMSPYVPAAIGKRPRFHGDDDDDLPVYIPGIGKVRGGELHGNKGAESIGASTSRNLPIAKSPSFGRGQYAGPVGMEGSRTRLDSYPGLALGGRNAAAGVHEMARKPKGQWADQSPFSPPAHPGTALSGPNPAAGAGPVGVGSSRKHLDSYPGFALGAPNPAAGVHEVTRKLEGQRIDQPTLPPPTNSTVFVEGLPMTCTKREAAHIFRPFFGFKDLRIVNKEPKFPRRERNVLCFVEFTEPQYAAHAIKVLQGYKFDIGDPASPCLKMQFARYDKTGVVNRGYR